MTPEEQRALVQFFGTVHAQAKQTDQMIVGQSQFVKPVSPVIQQQLERALHIPVQSNAPSTPQHYIEPAPPAIEVVDTAQAIQELQSKAEPVLHSPAINIPYDNELISVLKEINSNLDRIATRLEQKNEPKKIKTAKSD